MGIEPTTYSLVRVSQYVLQKLFLWFVIAILAVITCTACLATDAAIAITASNRPIPPRRRLVESSTVEPIWMDTLNDSKFNADLDSWIVYMTARSLSPATIEERTRLVNQIYRETTLDPRTLTADRITIWLATRHAPMTRHTYYLHLRAWFKWLVLTDRRLDNPMDKVEPPRRPPHRPRPCTDSQMRAVLALNLRESTRMKILLAAFAGLRIHEIAKIHGHDLNRVDGLLEVCGKGGRTEIVPLHPYLLSRAAIYPTSGYWFPTPGDPSHPVTPRSVGDVITKAFDRTGAHVTAHQLRHWFATSLLANGVDTRIVQTLMRHQDLATTAIYVGVSASQQRQALDRLAIASVFDTYLF
ncbi:MAG: tyrosine-type recombinase/integrase [Schaalia hyovaginalis]|uniref:tyrosine-type recombinase/integrase n=1 Tax=Schaalia hyovaginalis TaxID=29316 RepID=UPI002A807B9F|nr:tyrosine-type recombinase/integrase [Schaalia hyovaginalis]MDY4263122.1 tyrosine-type recombinase/integrase [Schaalia hyovaginalis]